MDLRLIFEILSAGFSAFLGYVALMVRLENANLRTAIAEARVRDLEQRAEERAELLKWLNGSFMRASVVGVQIAEIERRISEIEREQRP